MILWDDTFVRYHEPEIGKAAVKVMESLGYSVRLATGRRCCGRPAFSQGNLDEATRLGQHNLDLLRNQDPTLPIIFLEPSCYSMFAEDYRELGLRGAEEVRDRAVLFESFVADRWKAAPPSSLRANGATPVNVAIHAHCHAKALTRPDFMAKLVNELPNHRGAVLQTGCCGMAGAFGMLSSKYDLSVAVARPLLEQIEACPAGTTVVASGTSCRHQIGDLTGKTPRHMAEVLADAIQ